MSDKQKLLDALKQDNGKVDEFQLGLNLGFTEERTKELLDELVSDGNIEFQSFGLCSYVLR